MSHFIKDQDDSNETLLMHQIARQFRTSFDRRAQHQGLTRSQWRVLCMLRRHPGIHQSKLAEMLEIEPMSLARQLDRMQKTKLIERKPDPADRRANNVFMTAHAKTIMDGMQPLSLQIRKEAVKGFSAAEHQQLISYMLRIKDNITRMLSEEEQSGHAANHQS